MRPLRTSIWLRNSIEKCLRETRDASLVGAYGIGQTSGRGSDWPSSLLVHTLGLAGAIDIRGVLTGSDPIAGNVQPRWHLVKVGQAGLPPAPVLLPACCWKDA